MNQSIFDLASTLVSPTYLTQAISSRNNVSALIKDLLAQRRIPEEGWSEETIEMFLREVSLWDSNNFPSQSCVGEREGRCLSSIVSRRHWKLIHGIGRSGDVNAEQPKAAGSSFLLNLTRILVRDLLKNVFGMYNVPKEIVVLPIATGMSIMMGMTAITQMHYSVGQGVDRVNVIWSRIDQKSCIKAMTSNPALKLHIVEQCVNSEGILVTDFEAISALITHLGGSLNIHSIVLTTSTFAPRTPDNVPIISKICHTNDIPLVVNNAYGLQCTKCTHLITEAIRIGGRVDLVVSSTDKNLLVPVGGAILFGPIASRINKIYPGRASISPILDVLITILQIGKRKFIQLLQDRIEMFNYLKSQLATLKNVSILPNSKNNISLALEVKHTEQHIGTQLFMRNISGARFFVQNDTHTTIDQYSFKNFGCHTSVPICKEYLNVACAIGMKKEEIDRFIQQMIKIHKHTENRDSSSLDTC